MHRAGPERYVWRAVEIMLEFHPAQPIDDVLLVCMEMRSHILALLSASSQAAAVAVSSSMPSAVVAVVAVAEQSAGAESAAYAEYSMMSKPTLVKLLLARDQQVKSLTWKGKLMQQRLNRHHVRVKQTCATQNTATT